MLTTPLTLGVKVNHTPLLTPLPQIGIGSPVEVALPVFIE